jgi:hypothetical protein
MRISSRGIESIRKRYCLKESTFSMVTWILCMYT